MNYAGSDCLLEVPAQYSCASLSGLVALMKGSLMTDYDGSCALSFYYALMTIVEVDRIPKSIILEP